MRCTKCPKRPERSLFWGLDQAFGPEYAEGAGVRVRKRKSDTGRRGLCTRVPPGILLERLRRWIRDQGLEVSPLCTDKENPGARCPFCPPLFLPDDSRKLLTRAGFFNPSLDGGLPLLLLFSPSRRSNSASRPISIEFSARSNAFSACNASTSASPLAAAGAPSRESVSSGRAINTLTRTRP